MPSKAIMALRSYPLALFLAMLVFVCTLLIAANSIGKINGGGGDDEGSGLGGTGRNGDYGFGGTGGPRPFLGDADTDESPAPRNEPTSQGSERDWQAPWLPREPEPQNDTFIPAEMQPLVELQRNPVQDPFRTSPVPNDDPDRLYILDDEAAGMPAPVRQLLDMANSDENLIAPTVLELRLRVPEGPIDTGNIETYRMELAAEPAQPANPATETVNAEPLIPSAEEAAPSVEEAVTDQTLPALTETPNAGLAELSPGDSQEERADAEDSETDRRTSPERLQRPELPPFQRMRPAIDRASMVPPRIQPMNI